MKFPPSADREKSDVASPETFAGKIAPDTQSFGQKILAASNEARTTVASDGRGKNEGTRTRCLTGDRFPL